jgi:hypothetical protein
MAGGRQSYAMGHFETSTMLKMAAVPAAGTASDAGELWTHICKRGDSVLNCLIRAIDQHLSDRVF